MPNYGSNIDLKQNQILNAVMQKTPSPPSNPQSGQFYFNTTAGTLRAFYYNGAEWIGMDGTGATMTAADIVTAINGSANTIDDDNLSTNVNNAITNTHSHTNKTVLDNTTESFLTAHKSKLDNITVTQAVDLDTMESNVATNNAKVSNATHTGDVTGSTALTIANNVVTNAKLAQMPTMTIKGNNTAGTANAVDLTAAQAKTLLSLNNVTNDAQVKKSASSTNGNIPTWSGTTGDSLGAGYSVETTLSGGTSAIPRADAVKTYVDNLLGANDAMIFKGTLGTGGTITAIPTTYSVGWTYKVITAGTYAGNVCEIGDLIIAIVDRTGTGNANTDWVVIQTNLDGAVIGAASSTNGNFPIFSGTTGKLIANSTYGPGSFATSDHAHSEYNRTSTLLGNASVFNDIVVTNGIVTWTSTRTLTPENIGAATAGHTHSYTSKYVTTIGNASATSFVVTHNLNTQDATVTIRETASPYAMWITDVSFTTVNTITIDFGFAPTLNQFTVTVIG